MSLHMENVGTGKIEPVPAEWSYYQFEQNILRGLLRPAVDIEDILCNQKTVFNENMEHFCAEGFSWLFTTINSELNEGKDHCIEAHRHWLDLILASVQTFVDEVRESYDHGWSQAENENPYFELLTDNDRPENIILNKAERYWLDPLAPSQTMRRLYAETIFNNMWKMIKNKINRRFFGVKCPDLRKMYAYRVYELGGYKINKTWDSIKQDYMKAIRGHHLHFVENNRR